MGWGKTRNKYGATKTQYAGHWFDSKLEAAVFSLLSLRERAGEIRDLTHHPGTVFLSEARVQSRPDFKFIDVKSGEMEWAEAKGYPTREWAIKKRLWKSYGPGKLWIYGGSASYVKLLQTVIPKREK